LEPPLPHPFTSPTPARLTASSASSGQFLRFLQPSQHSAIATAVSGHTGIPRRCNAALADAVVTVSTVEVVPGGVTVAGKKLQVAPAGNPEHANETAESNPPAGETVIVVVPLLPPFTVNELGAAATVNPGGGRLMV
jgi:hypothetical protein